jgi:hypothetical protein
MGYTVAAQVTRGIPIKVSRFLYVRRGLVKASALRSTLPFPLVSLKGEYENRKSRYLC